MKHYIPSFLLLVCMFSCKTPDSLWIIQSPAGEKYTKIDTSGVTVIPNGRLIKPIGHTFRTAPHPYGLCLSHDGNTAVTANSGTSPLSITILRNIRSDHPEIQQIPPGAKTDDGVLASVFMGLAISPDDQTVYVSGGQENKIYLFDLNTGQEKGSILCGTVTPERDYSHGYIGDMTLNKAGDRLYAVDQINFILLVIDPLKMEVLSRVNTGRYPFGVCLSPDEMKAYVANVGMYEYTRIASTNKDSITKTSLAYPAYAYLSKESEEGINNDSVHIKGLGKPNTTESFSVWTIDISDQANPKVIAKAKTGTLVGEMLEDFPAVGGSSPNSLVATNDYVFVSNGNNDNISVLDIRTDTVFQTIPIILDQRLRSFRGIIPFGLAVTPDQKRLFVAESGINAIAVIDIPSKKVVGHIPVGWFPAKIQVTPDGKKLIVTNAKGYGSGPNGGPDFKKGPEGTYIGSLMKGSVTVLDIPSDGRLRKMTKEVIEMNFLMRKSTDPSFANRKDNPVPLYPGFSQSPIKYIVFVSKENRTFDEIFGQVKAADGEPSLARFGAGVSFTNKAKTRSVNQADIMINHLSLANRYAMSDNFYVDSDVSADGHRWLVNTYPNEWVETSVPASYGGNRDYRETSKAPGVLGITGSAGAIYPEDYNEAGSMWDHLDRHKIPFYNFGFSIMFEPGAYQPEYKTTGIRHLANFPLPAPLFENTSREYATFNMAIPDQYRIDQFLKTYQKKWTKGTGFPSVMTIILPNDHGAGERADAGFPFMESYECDNDLALGRLVEFLSNTPYWKNMAIVITEDDAQGGVDHVDAHRSVCMVVSPYAKKNYVSHGHYSFGSIFKTFWNILGIPYLNQYDAGATDLSDLFTQNPDFTPYQAIPVDIRVFDPAKALDPLDEKFDWKAVKESPEIDNVKDMLRNSKEMEEWRK
ncbi:MAG: bifunctional YncE family protein/alkaline phosphatase family protein [Bacteroidales bacterium]|nr:bifunctional YncE family protein/alkaline phosphatase family protein [Bacteroidales bacterium]